MSDIYDYKQLQAECLKKGISIKKLCEKAGVSYRQVAQWKPRRPSALEVMEKLTQQLKNEKTNLKDGNN